MYKLYVIYEIIVVSGGRKILPRDLSISDDEPPFDLHHTDNHTTKLLGGRRRGPKKKSFGAQGRPLRLRFTREIKIEQEEPFLLSLTLALWQQVTFV